MGSKKSILTLDLGTKTGWARAIDDPWWKKTWGEYTYGTVDFSTKRLDGGGMRYLNFNRWLEYMNLSNKINEIYFEEVLGHKGTVAAHVYGGFLGGLMSWCEKYKIPYQGVPVSTIKKHITGKGNASKQMVIDAVKAKGYDVQDDNQADAMALLLYVEQMMREKGDEI
jgi:crossover junction endodeoxyribonuclease RuvC